MTASSTFSFTQLLSPIAQLIFIHSSSSWCFQCTLHFLVHPEVAQWRARMTAFISIVKLVAENRQPLWIAIAPSLYQYAPHTFMFPRWKYGLLAWKYFMTSFMWKVFCKIFLACLYILLCVLFFWCQAENLASSGISQAETSWQFLNGAVLVRCRQIFLHLCYCPIHESVENYHNRNRAPKNISVAHFYGQWCVTG